MNEERPSPIPKVIRRWWSLAAFLALICWELYSSNQSGTPPNWIWIGIAVLGLVFVALVNFGNMRK